MSILQVVLKMGKVQQRKARPCGGGAGPPPPTSPLQQFPQRPVDRRNVARVHRRHVAPASVGWASAHNQQPEHADCKGGLKPHPTTGSAGCGRGGARDRLARHHPRRRARPSAVSGSSSSANVAGSGTADPTSSVTLSAVAPLPQLAV